MNRLIALSSAVLICLCQMAGCEPASERADEGLTQQAEVLRRGNGGDPGTLDPALAEDIHAFNILADLYEGLVAEAADGRLIPGVAETWDVGDDGRSYTFRLRPNARWSNGDPVHAADFVRAFRRVASPDTLSAYAFLLQPLKNFDEVKAGKEPASALGAVADDERTLTLTLAQPTSHFLAALTMPVTFPMHVESPAAAANADVDAFIGNGAYILEDRVTLGPIRLRRNTHYWDAASVKIEEVLYLPTSDDGPELNMYRAGELDITNTIPTGQFDSLRESMPSEVRVAPSLALYYLAFDLSEPPLDNRHLRQALSMAIDRNRLVNVLGRGESPAFGIVPPGVANHAGAEYDWRGLSETERIERARKAFADSGHDPGKPLRLTFVYDVGSIHERVALVVSQMWRDVLGIDTVLEKREWKYFLETRANRSEWQVMRFSWFGDYNDPMTFLEIFRSDSPQNLPLHRNAGFDSLLDGASAEQDPAERVGLMNSAERELLDAYPVAPLYFFVSKHLVKPRVRGFEDNVLDRHPSKYLYFDIAE